MENIKNKYIFLILSLSLHFLILLLPFKNYTPVTINSPSYLNISNFKIASKFKKFDKLSTKNSGILKTSKINKTESAAHEKNDIDNKELLANKVKAQISVNYPIRARKNGIEGNVVVQCEISKDGVVKSINIVASKSSSAEILINEIKRAVMAAKFSDLKEDTSVELAFSFTLTN